MIDLQPVLSPSDHSTPPAAQHLPPLSHQQRHDHMSSNPDQLLHSNLRNYFERRHGPLIYKYSVMHLCSRYILIGKVIDDNGSLVPRREVVPDTAPFLRQSSRRSLRSNTVIAPTVAHSSTAVNFLSFRPTNVAIDTTNFAQCIGCSHIGPLGNFCQ